MTIGDTIYYVLPKGGPRTETLYMQGTIVNITPKRIVWQPTQTTRRWLRNTIASKMVHEVPPGAKIV